MHYEIIDSYFNIFFVEIELKKENLKNVFRVPEVFQMAWICNCCRAVITLLAASLEPLAYCRNVAFLTFFYMYDFGSSELAQLVPLPYSCGRFFFLSPLFDVTRVSVYGNSFFPHTARLWNFLPIECFPLNYDLKV